MNNHNIYYTHSATKTDSLSTFCTVLQSPKQRQKTGSQHWCV